MPATEISIIVPVYNSAETIEACVDSIKAQTFDGWALILVDNGSTDGSMALLQNMASGDPRITVLCEREKGVANARNAALDVSKGKYVCFVDSDDLIEPDYLERLLSSPVADLTVCGYFVDAQSETGEPLYHESFIPDNVFWASDINKSNLIPAFQSGLMHLCCNKLFRRDIIEENHIRFKHYPVNEDYLFTLDFLQYAKSISIIDAPLYHWIRVEGNVSGVKSIPDNLLQIYNESHLATRQFFEDNSIADKIAYFSYELIVYKYYEAINTGRITKQIAFSRIEKIVNNNLVKSAYEAYKPKSKGETFLYLLLRMGLYKAHYYLTQRIMK